MQFAIVYTLIEPNLEVGKGFYNSKPQKSKTVELKIQWLLY